MNLRCSKFRTFLQWNETTIYHSPHHYRTIRLPISTSPHFMALGGNERISSLFSSLLGSYTMLRVIYNSHRAPLLAPLTTAASIGAAVFSQRNDDSATTPAKKLLLEEPSRWLSFSAILPNYTSNLSSRDKCSCESLFSRPSSHATQSILVNASTKATVESKYTVDWKHPLGEVDCRFVPL